MRKGKRIRYLRTDTDGVESPLEDLLSLVIVMVVIVVFISSLATIYGIREDQDRRFDLWDRCMSFSNTVLTHPMLLDDTYDEEGLFSGYKLQLLKTSYEERLARLSEGGDGTAAPPGDGGGGDPIVDFDKSVDPEEKLGWELYFQDMSGYPSRSAFTFSLRSDENMTLEVQSLVWSISIYIDADEVHAARLTVLVWEV